MSTQQDRKPTHDPVDEQSIANYLREHPDFFQRHTSLLALLNVPHECGPAVSLVQYQVSVLRDQIRDLKRKLKDLVEFGRENDRLNERMLQFTLALMEAHSVDEVLQVVQEQLFDRFKADAVSLRLFNAPEQVRANHPEIPLDRNDARLSAFENFFKTKRPLCGRLRQEQLEVLFGARAETIGSAVLIALDHQGLLAIGSHDQDHFHPGMGTVFLTRMGAIVSGALRRCGASERHG